MIYYFNILILACFSMMIKHNLSAITKLWHSLSVSRFKSYGTCLYTNNSIICRTFSSLSKPSLQRTISHIHEDWVTHFRGNNVPDPELSIKYIFEYIFYNNSKERFEYDMNKDMKVTEEQEEEIKILCEARLARMPVQYIIKEWDFRELRLAMCPPVFIPRPETEQLVDLVLDSVLADVPSTMLEIGCGSGAICLSLVKALPKAQLIAVDQSKLACALTLRNAQLNLGAPTDNIQVVHSKLQEDGSLSEPLPLKTGTVDVIVSNPPYVPTANLLDLQPEIKLYEDLRALEAGKDGLRVIRSVLLLSRSLLRPGGQIFLEVDSRHPPLVEKWLQKHPELNLRLVRTVRDYCDRDRFLLLNKS